MLRLQATVFIYALFDPRQPEVVRYVGKTEKKIEIRRMRHMGEARRGKRNHRCNWIRSLLAAGIEPGVRMLAEVSRNGWQEHERAFIQRFRQTITNGTDGGDGLENPSDEVREKMSIANRGRIESEETRRRKSESAGKRRWPESVKRKISESKSANFSDETRQKISDANRRRRLSEETRRKIAEKQRAHQERLRKLREAAT